MLNEKLKHNLHTLRHLVFYVLNKKIEMGCLLLIQGGCTITIASN